MTAKETIRAKLFKLRLRARQTGQVRLPASAVALWTEAGIHFLLSAVLSGAVLLGDCAPFGVAFVGAAGSGLWGMAALAGACLGSVCLLELTQGLRCASAATLTFAVAFAFYDWKLLRQPWAMPLIAGAINAATGVIVRSQAGWTPSGMIAFALETALTVGACRCYALALAPLRPGRQDRLPSPAGRAGLLVLTATVLLALAPLHLIQDVSVGRCLAALTVLAAASQAGSAPGTILGAVLGAAMDLGANATPVYTMAYALGGLAAGAVRGKGRPAAALAFAGTNAAALLWTWGRGLPLSGLYEGALAALIFLPLPQGSLGVLGSWLAPELSGPGNLGGERLVQRQLESASAAFRSLSETLRAAFRPPRNDNDVSVIFDRAAGKLCRSCALRDRCWKQDYASTFNAMNDATAPMMARGSALAEDFPRYFADRCLHFPAYVAAVDRELAALLYRRQYNARVGESRSAVCRQYAQLSELLHAAAAELSQELTPDLTGERRLRQMAAELGLEVRTAAFRDSRGLLHLEAEGPGCAALARPERLSELSALLGVPLRLERRGEGSLSLIQQEPLMAVAGVAAQRKGGETVSGDAGTYFKRPDGMLYVLLCDGMGSGPEANRESTLAVRLLEQFLQAGVPARQALSTLASALALRGEDAGGFTTVDLLQIDLFTGDGELYKLGAAPTYVKRSGAVQRLSGSALPAGLSAGEEPVSDRFPLRLSPGDTVLMVSDGICGTGDDRWLREKLEAFDGASPKDLARELITQSPQGATDDRTALVIRVEKRRVFDN